MKPELGVQTERSMRLAAIKVGTTTPHGKQIVIKSLLLKT